MDKSKPKPVRKARPRPKYQTHGKRKERKPLKAKTHDGILIQGLMAATGVKGNYKDFVIMSGSRLIDWCGTVDVAILDGVPIKSLPALVHKRDLHRFIGEAALQYWSPATGRQHPGPRAY